MTDSETEMCARCGVEMQPGEDVVDLDRTSDMYFATAEWATVHLACLTAVEVEAGIAARKEAAAVAVIDVLAGLDLGGIPSAFSCSEAEILADLCRAHSRDEVAEMFLDWHSWGDVDGEDDEEHLARKALQEAAP